MSRCFIHNAASITNRGLDLGFQLDVNRDKAGFSVVEPEYGDLVPAGLRRRMTKITRMGMACARALGVDLDWEAIIVGTALGNMSDTLQHLEKIRQSQGGLIAPTSFIQSGHNTLAGQIALSLKNHGYNATYVQGGLSFASVLIDAKLQFAEGANQVLVGAVDEKIPELEILMGNAGFEPASIQRIGEGASFFHLSSSPSPFEILDVRTVSVTTDLDSVFAKLTSDLGLDSESVIRVHSHTFTRTSSPFDYTESIGAYFTNDAFALHLTCSLLNQKSGKYGMVIHEGEGGVYSFTTIQHVTL